MKVLALPSSPRAPAPAPAAVTDIQKYQPCHRLFDSSAVHTTTKMNVDGSQAIDVTDI